MGISLTNIGTATNSTGATLAVTVPAGGVPAGALIVVAVTEKNTTGTAGTVADSGGSNTYTKITQQSINGSNTNGLGMVFDVQNASALTNGQTITYTKNASGVGTAMSVFYATGIKTSSAIDTSVTNTGHGSSTSPSVTAAGTPANAADLFIGLVFTGGGGGTFTQDSTNGAYTTPPNEEVAATGRVSGGSLVVSGTPSAQKYNPSYGSSTGWAAIMVAFIPSSTIITSTGTLTGTGSLSGVGASLDKSTGTLAGTGSLSGVGTGVIPSAGTLSGTGSLVGHAIALALGVGTLAGDGQLNGVGAGQTQAIGTLSGQGSLSGIGASLFKAVGLLSGTGSLMGVSPGGFSTGTLAGSGNLSGISGAIDRSVGEMIGQGFLSGVGHSFSNIVPVIWSDAATNGPCCAT